MANSEITSPSSTVDQGSGARPGAQSRAEALEYIKDLRESAGRVIGEEATKVAFVAGPDGIIMTDSDQAEAIKRRREHGGHSPEDRDYLRG